ncbi:MAG: hypothetical protein ACXVXO_12725 [Mycobacteriaceae bacterium]
MLDLEPASHMLAGLVEGMRDDQLTAPTPCIEASLGDLLDHVELSMAFTAAATKTPMACRCSASAGVRLGAVVAVRPVPARPAAVVRYFHGDNGAGLGGSHQTGWTSLAADLIDTVGQGGPSRLR